jgi:hypothetical protein
VEGLGTRRHRMGRIARWGLVALLLVTLCTAVAPGTALAADADTATISSVTPRSGPIIGGTTVVIAGTGLANVAKVSFAGTAVAPGTPSDTQVTVVAPPGTAGAAAITLAFADTSTLGAGTFTYVAAPTVAQVSPNAGPIAGNGAVTLTGTGFQTGAAVTFDGSAATGITVNGDTSITATPPDHAAGAVDVTVTNPDTQSGTLSGGFTYVAAPTLASLSTSAGPAGGGTSLTITGTDLMLASAVTFGGTDAISFTAASDTRIIATTPAHAASTVDVVVTTPGGGATLTGAYAFIAAPTITGITPATGSTDADELTQVTLTGTGFQTGITVAFGGVAATGITLVGPTTITATAPAHPAGAVDVVVTNPDGQGATLAGGFTYAQGGHGPPSHGGLSVRQIEPPAGSTAGRDQIVIKGTGFAAGATVTIGGAAASDVRVLNSTTIGATTPAHAAGTVDVTVASGGTSATLGGAYTYRDGQGRGDGGPPAGRGNGGNGGNGGPPPGQTPQGRHGQGGSQPAGSGNPGQQPGNAPTHR